MSLTPDAAGKRAANPAIDTLFLLAALSAMFIVTTQSLQVSDPDIWLHLKTGQWILTSHSVPTRDSFSAHAAGQPWVAYSWLFDVLVYAIYSTAGYRGLLMLATGATLLYTAALIVFLERFINLRRAMILSFTATVALMPLKSPRPWLFTILFFAIELCLLWLARELKRPGWLLPIVPLFALWANLHIQFVYGLGLIGMFALETLVPAASGGVPSDESRPVSSGKWLWLLLAASCLATLLNPYGWNLYREVALYATQGAPFRYIQEFQAMPFRVAPNWVCLVLIGTAIFALGFARGKSLLLTSVLVVSCYFGFRSQRDIWFPVTVAALALASTIRTFAPEFVRSRCKYGIAIPLSLAIACGAIAVNGKFSDESLSREGAKTFPVHACSYIESHNLPGPLFNSYDWGDYLIWRLPRMPVSIDGRTDLNNDFLPRVTNTLGGAKDWEHDPGLIKARTILLPLDLALTSILRVNPKFRLIYQDETAAIFQPLNPPTAK